MLTLYLLFSEALYEDEKFPNRELAALVAAKVYYQLQEYNESMVFALGAGKLFDLDRASEFEETIVGMFGDDRSGQQDTDKFQRNVSTPTLPCRLCTTHLYPPAQQAIPSLSLVNHFQAPMAALRVLSARPLQPHLSRTLLFRQSRCFLVIRLRRGMHLSQEEETQELREHTLHP